jgi:hypothetical protein
MNVPSNPPRPGQVVVLDRAASVQFDGDRGLTVQILEVDEQPTLEGWTWLTVAVLGPPAARKRAAVRTVFVQAAGLRPATVPEELLGMPRGRRITAPERTDAVPQLVR